MEQAVADDNVHPANDDDGFALEAGHPTARRLDQHDAGGDVPGEEGVALDHAVDAGGRDGGQGQRPRAEPAPAAARPVERRGSSFWRPVVTRARSRTAVVDTASDDGPPRCAAKHSSRSGS